MNKPFFGCQSGEVVYISILFGSVLATISPADTIRLTGIVWSPIDHVAYAVTGNVSPIHPNSLYSIDMATGVKTFIGANSLGKPISDITIDASGNLFGVTAGENPRPVSINKSTGHAAYIGPTINVAEWGGACEIVGGVYYYFGQNNFDYTVDLGTGVATYVATRTGVGATPNACSYNADDGKMYLAEYFQLKIVDLVTGVVTYVGDLGAISLPSSGDAFMWAPLVAELPIPAPIPSPGIDIYNGWFIDSYAHDGLDFSLIATYKPENLHFIDRISAVSDYDWEVTRSAVDISGNLVVSHVVDTDEDSFKPKAYSFEVKKLVDGTPVYRNGGFIWNTNVALGREFVKVSGKDWLQYLDGRQIPFDPANPNDFVFGPSSATVPEGLSYQEASRDVALIAKDVLDAVLARPYSLPMTYSLSAIGIAINYQLSLGDTASVLTIIDALATYWPGFDYKTTYDRVFEIWSPFRYGDEDETVDNGAYGGNICLRVGTDFGQPAVDIEYTNSGPQYTHLFGTGAGTVNQTKLGRAIGASDNQNRFWRWDDSIDYGDQAKNQDVLNMRTRRDFIRGVQEVHDIVLTVDPNQIENFWTTVKPGLALWLKEDLQLHQINSAQRIIAMECNVNNQEDEKVVFGLNQLYDTADFYGVPEG